MVGLMATFWRTRGSTAFMAAVGLLLLALGLVAVTPTWAGGIHHRAAFAMEVVTPGAEVSTLSTLPTAAVRGTEHLPRLWPAGNRTQSVPETPGLTWPASGSAAICDPQQSGHRTAGSRSPPLA